MNPNVLDGVKDIVLMLTVIGIAYNVGTKLGEMSTSLKQMADTFKQWGNLPERLMATEITLQNHERRITSGGL